MDVDQLVKLIQAHAWIPVASIVIGLLVRLMKSDAAVAWFPITIPPRVRSWIALGLGLVAGVLDKVVAGSTWVTALIGGLVAAITAMTSHDLVIESLRNGRELGEANGDPSGGAKPPSPRPSLRPKDPAGPYSAKMVGRAAVAFALAISLTMTGCPGGLSQIPQWIQSALVVMQNFASILDGLRSATDLFLATASPSDSVKQTVEQAFVDTAMAEAGLTELLNAGDDVTQGKLDAARDKVLAAYSNLVKLLGSLGVVNEVASGAFKAAKSGQVVMTPLLLRERIVK